VQIEKYCAAQPSMVTLLPVKAERLNASVINSYTARGDPLKVHICLIVLVFVIRMISLRFYLFNGIHIQILTMNNNFRFRVLF
jgi:hypothetical protein